MTQTTRNCFQLSLCCLANPVWALTEFCESLLYVSRMMTRDDRTAADGTLVFSYSITSEYNHLPSCWEIGTVAQVPLGSRLSITRRSAWVTSVGGSTCWRLWLFNRVRNDSDVSLAEVVCRIPLWHSLLFTALLPVFLLHGCGVCKIFFFFLLSFTSSTRTSQTTHQWLWARVCMVLLRNSM